MQSLFASFIFSRVFGVCIFVTLQPSECYTIVLFHHEISKGRKYESWRRKTTAFGFRSFALSIFRGSFTFVLIAFMFLIADRLPVSVFICVYPWQKNMCRYSLLHSAEMLRIFIEGFRFFSTGRHIFPATVGRPSLDREFAAA